MTPLHGRSHSHSHNRMHSRLNAARRLLPGWPALVGLLALLAGLCMLAAAAYLGRQTDTARAAARAPATAQPQPPAARTQDDPGPSTPPPLATHLEDIGTLFRIAKPLGVTLGPIAYTTEPLAPLPVVLRVVELRVDEDYPRLKTFIADLLRMLPHASLREIRVDQDSADKTRVRASVKLVLAYQSEAVRDGRR